MSSGGDEVENDVHPSVLELCVTLDTGLLSEEPLLLVLDVLEDLDESLRVVDVVTEPWGVDHRQNNLLSIGLDVCRRDRIEINTGKKKKEKGSKSVL